MKYSIIIPTYNHCDDLLKPLINSIFMYTNLEDAEIIVVANGCTDGTREYLESFAIKYLFFDEPIGFAKAINAGAEVATGEYLVLLNNDTILQSQYINQWLDMLRDPFKDPLMGVTGPSILHFQPLSCDFVVFFCAMIPRLLFNHIGGLSEEYKVGGGEDVEFCYRIQKLNYKIAQVPDTGVSKANNGYIVGKFPIIHEAESTVKTIPNWDKIFHTNMSLVTVRNMKQKGIVMVIIPAHNAADTIVKALRSVEGQTYILWHMVVIDDASTDSTVNIAENVFSEPNFAGKCTLIKTNNHSPSHSRNTAINMLVNPAEYNVPECDYVAFLDADDWWMPSHLAESLIAIDGYGMSYGPVIAMNDKMEILTPFGIPVNQEPTLENIEKANSIYISTAVLTTECIKTVGYFNSELDSVEDWDYWIRVLKSGRGINKIDTIQAYYLVRSTGMAGKVTPQQIAVIKGDPVKLNLGCGDEILPGYINIDINNDKADVEADCASLPYGDNSVDEVRAYHLIEHFTFKNAFNVLKEWRRVLKPGGRLVLETPDFFHTCKKFVESDERTQVMLYGHFFAFPDLSPWQAHYFLYTEGQLTWTLRECGFTDIKRETPPDSTYAKANPHWPDLYLKMSAVKPM